MNGMTSVQQRDAAVAARASKSADVDSADMPDDVDDDDEEDGSGDDEDEEEDQQDEDLLDEEDQDEGVDEEGPIGQWTKPGGPRNPGATIWLTNRKEMCRLVHPDGQYMVSHSPL